MRLGWIIAVSSFVGCAPRHDLGTQGPTPEPVDEAEPPPHYHDYPEIPPDELGTPPSDESEVPPDTAALDCPLSEPPPAPPPKRIRSGPPVTNYIPPVVIMKPVRARASCFRGCYRAGLARNEKLAGRIAIRFVIDLDGWVRRARIAQNDLEDADVSECIRRSFEGLQYEEPGAEPVTVVYPLVFQPSADPR